MLKRLLFPFLFATLAITMGHALDHPSSKVVIPVGRTSPADGKQMFTSYCAPCHGADGRGNGYAASALRVVPTDLSNLTMVNKGKFPDSHLVSVLRFGADGSKHGTAQMPEWGPIFASMNRVNPMDREQRMSNLVEYVRTLQVR